MRGYKAFNKDLTCRGFQYEVSKTYTAKGEVEMCKNGFHFCKKLADVYEYYPHDARICEVEADGVIEELKKCVAKRITVVRELSMEEIINLRNSGNWNSGDRNSGNWNSGDWNSGNRNSGDRNSGNWNSGNSNSGNWNSGDRNSGNSNSGNWNSGDGNSGNWNSGDWNSGDRNSGDRNSGNWNSGDWNSGDWNSGDWNSGDWNSGVFCTESPNIKIFDIDTDWKFEDWIGSNARFAMDTFPCNTTRFIDESEMSEQEKGDNPDYTVVGGYLKITTPTDEEKQAWWDELSDDDKKAILSLPNFDAKKFKEITGVDVNNKVVK